jgi:diadenosine tetraphosphate (Ap4A) HIT family hydrolase
VDLLRIPTNDQVRNIRSEAQAAGVAPWDLEVDRLSDFHVAVFQDRYPVAPGHLLFVPQYNTDAVIYDCFETAMREGRRMVADGECDAFNIGINMGAAAGQTVMYPHVHLIPRRPATVLTLWAVCVV